MAYPALVEVMQAFLQPNGFLLNNKCSDCLPHGAQTKNNFTRNKL